jgi:hypothetical protein
MISDMLVHVLNCGIFHFPSEVRRVMERLQAYVDRKGLRGLGALMIARAYMLSRYSGVCRLPSAHWVDEWFLALLNLSDIHVPALEWAVREATGKARLDLYQTDYRRAVDYWITFITSWWRFPLFNGTLGGISSIPLILASPAFWSYIIGHFTGLRYFLPHTLAEVEEGPLFYEGWASAYKFCGIPFVSPSVYGTEGHPGPAIADLSNTLPPRITVAAQMEHLRAIVRLYEKFIKREKMTEEYRLSRIPFTPAGLLASPKTD